MARGADVAVIVSDTFGRAWRGGQTNVAIGVAGLSAFRDHRGDKDTYGQLMEATLIAVADEIAGAAELVMGKTDGVPVAIVRGVPQASFGPGTARELIRPPEEDLFRTGTLEGIEGRRSVRAFAEHDVSREVIERAVAAAATAPAPHASRVGRPWRFVWLRTETPRGRFLAAMEEAWKRDLDHDHTPFGSIERRLERSRTMLGQAPVLLACFVNLAGADRYPDATRLLAEREMFIAAAGGAIQNLMLALSAEGVGSCWLSTSLFCSDDATSSLGLGSEWQAVGCVIVGYPETAPPGREPLDPKPFLDVR